MVAAGDVRARHHREQAVVVGDLLAQVRVEVDVALVTVHTGDGSTAPGTAPEWPGKAGEGLCESMSFTEPLGLTFG